MQTSKVSFNGVTPYRVFINGQQSADIKNMQKAERALVKVFAGPTQKTAEHRNLSAVFAKGDKDYSFERALNGYIQDKGETPSDYFRALNDREGQFIITGKFAQRLKEFGKKLGLVKQMQNQYNIQNSYELNAAKNNYGKLVHSCLNSANERTKINGRPVILNIYTESSGTYGKKDFKLKLKDINWSFIN
ncbi:MAG: hypothetical protein MRZ62_00780 [Brachyspira sp.]|nr:hypothetical protein [Brachyspira sp.]